MGLLSVFKKQGDSAAAPGSNDGGDAVLQARTRARRRLIGAVVLLGVGIIGFPLVFETQPRPIPVDIPIEIPRKEGAAPLVVPAPRAKVASREEAKAPDMITETAADAGKEVPAPAASAADAAAPARAAVHPK